MAERLAGLRLMHGGARQLRRRALADMLAGRVATRSRPAALVAVRHGGHEGVAAMAERLAGCVCPPTRRCFSVEWYAATVSPVSLISAAVAYRPWALVPLHPNGAWRQRRQPDLDRSPQATHFHAERSEPERSHYMNLSRASSQTSW